MSEHPLKDRGPRAFRLDETGAPTEDARLVLPEVDPYELEAARLADMPPVVARRRFFSWGKLFWSAFGSFAALAAGLWAVNLVEALLAANPVLGWAAATLAGLAALALAVILFRELWSLRRLGRVEELRAAAQAAFEADDAAAARDVVSRLRGLQTSGPRGVAARAALDDLKGEIIDGVDLIKVAERVVLAPQDAVARAVVASAASRVSMVTAISPRAIVDVLFVLAQSVRMVRRAAEAYGGRPSFLGALRLGRAVIGHLTVTGGMAIGDGLIGQVLGAGLAARLSAKLGEGVLNGVLTARIGLAAIAVCRPMPFLSEKPPLLSDVAGALLSPSRAASGQSREESAG
jgi:putative membrane protein